MAKDWKEIVIALCARPDWSQRAVGEYLGVKQQTVGDWSTGKRPVPALYKIRLAGMANWDKTALALEDILPDEVATAWADWNKEGTAKLGRKLEEKANKKETAENSKSLRGKQ